MKKITVALSLVLGLFSISATQAQIKVLSNGYVKMGGMSSSTSTDYGLDIGYSKIRFHTSGSVSSSVANPTDIYIHRDCTGSGGPGIFLSSEAPNAIYSCRVTLEGDNLYLGTVTNPASLVTTNGSAIVSDLRYKDNIRNMEGGLTEILQLQPVRFDYKQLKTAESPWDSLARLNRVGFIAQDVEPIIPEAVNYNPFDDFYSLSPSALIPYLVASIQELNATVLALTERIETLEADNTAMVTPTFSNVKPNGNLAETLAIGNKLWSNVPNPFKQETRIRYALTEDVREAQLCIYDLSGKQLSCHR
ncbi:MAG: tail fiber domain-containing protein, partial [Bacteroidales bacterium]|nr:tail fiber domain-containing protein [Bacteroidales bacterium]